MGMSEADVETDVTIVPDNSDLNVYKRTDENGTETGCCGPAARKSSCCGGGMDAEPQEEEGGFKLQEELKDVDLNEWAGRSRAAVNPKCSR